MVIFAYIYMFICTYVQVQDTGLHKAGFGGSVAVGLVRMCAPAQMVELWKRNLNYGEARARHNYLC